MEITSKTLGKPRKYIDSLSGTDGSSIQPTSSLPPTASQGSDVSGSTSSKLRGLQIPSINEFSSSNEQKFLEEIGIIDVIPVAELLSSVLRPISSNDLLYVKNSLVERGHISDNGRWKYFSKSPSEYADDPSIFKSIERIYADLIDVATSCGLIEWKTSLLAPLLVRDDTELGKLSTSKPEGCLYLRGTSLNSNTSGMIDYADIAFFMALSASNGRSDRIRASI
ncbi:hypothetical protein CPB86DRAFT_819507 [Serendipita vermifera]|nr:hypothetical protein CPB86DRAFT_819507 [Serendipita vermifera]